MKNQNSICVFHTGTGATTGSSEWKCNISRTLLFRILVCFSLLVATGLFASIGFQLLTESELRLAEKKYKLTADAGLSNIEDSLERMNYAVLLHAEMMSEENPELSMWPNVTMGLTEKVCSLVRSMSGLAGISYLPLLQPEQGAEFEAFAYNHFRSDPDIPNGRGVSAFGEGISRINPFAGYADFKEHDTTGVWYGFISQYTVLVPFFEVFPPGRLDEYYFMLNAHSNHVAGHSLDSVMDCWHGQVNQGSQSPGKSCGSLSTFVGIPQPVPSDLFPDLEDAFTLILHPVHPQQNSTSLTGFIQGMVSWTGALTNAFPSSVSGLYVLVEAVSTDLTAADIEVSTSEVLPQAFLYGIDAGTAKLDSYSNDGEQLVKDKKGLRRHFKRSLDLNNIGNTVDATSVQYTISVYAKDEFFEEYYTDLPLYVCLGVVLVMALAGLIFFLYDMNMNSAFYQHQKVLEARRKFVRFVSHEMRTPLNSGK